MASPSEGQQEVMTYLFLDLESTGLPSPGNYPRITEISMISVDRQELCSFANPRVLNKLTLCIYPLREMGPTALKVTGLHNYNLYHQKDFDQGTADLVLQFLKRLPPPVCLIAHNGLHYDFPLLLAEFMRVGRKLPTDLLCADSLQIFRSLDAENGVLSASQPNLQPQLPVKRKLFPDQPETSNKRSLPERQDSQDTSSSQLSDSSAHKNFIEDDADAEVIDDDDETVDGASISSDATADYFPSLPGVDELLDEIEQSQSKEKLDDWGSDVDEMDDNTLLVCSQYAENSNGNLDLDESSQESQSLLNSQPQNSRRIAGNQGSTSTHTQTQSEARNSDSPAMQKTQGRFQYTMNSATAFASTPEKFQRMTPPKLNRPVRSKQELAKPGPSGEAGSYVNVQWPVRLEYSINTAYTNMAGQFQQFVNFTAASPKGEATASTSTPSPCNSGSAGKSSSKKGIPQSNQTPTKSTTHASLSTTNSQPSPKTPRFEYTYNSAYSTPKTLPRTIVKNNSITPNSSASTVKSVSFLASNSRTTLDGVSLPGCSQSPQTFKNSWRTDGAYTPGPAFKSNSQTPESPLKNGATQSGQDSPRMRYNLRDLHYRILNCYPEESHHAEADTMALLRICCRRATEVCAWIDAHCTLFNLVRPMYVGKFSKILPEGVFPYQQ